MTNPTYLVNEPHHICYELPPGKLNKEGTARVLQKKQKGGTCWYYAIRRILTEQQIRSEHGRACSLRRKQITRADSTLHSSRKEINQRRTEANLIFLQNRGFIDPTAAVEEYALDTLLRSKGIAPEMFNPAQKQELITAHRPTVLARMAYHISSLANDVLLRGYGLEPIIYRDLYAIEDWISCLKEKGPLVVYSTLAFFIFTTPPVELETIAYRKVYSWPKNVEYLPMEGTFHCYHAIVVLGAQKKEGGKSYIYWIDPNDPSDPHNPDTQRIFKVSFQLFKDNLRSIYAGLPIAIHEQFLSHREFPIAVYNPYLSISPQC